MLVMEKVSSVISRGAMYELLYQPKEHDAAASKAIDNLFNCTVQLYFTVLKIIALCRRLLSKSTTQRAMHSFFNPEEVSEFFARCEGLEMQADREASNCHSVRSQRSDAKTEELLQILQNSIDLTKNRMDNVLLRMNRDEQAKILGWISNISYGLNHQTVTDERTAGTCEWILDHRDYLKWKQKDSLSTLWLCGTGKLQIRAFIALTYLRV